MTVKLRRSTQDFPRATSAQVVFEDSVWIVEITKDQIETGKMTDQFAWQLLVLCEKTGERPVLDRADSLCIKSILGERGNVFVAENLDTNFGIRVAQCL